MKKILASQLEGPDLLTLEPQFWLCCTLIRAQREGEVTYPHLERGRGAAPHFCPSESSPEEAKLSWDRTRAILVEPVEQTGRSLILVLQSQ